MTFALENSTGDKPGTMVVESLEEHKGDFEKSGNH